MNDIYDDRDPMVVKKVAEAPEWWFFGRNLTILEHATIALKPWANTGEFADAEAVLGCCGGLTVTEIKAMFRDRKLRVSDFDGWQALANATGRIINFVHGHGRPSGTITHTYSPM